MPLLLCGAAATILAISATPCLADSGDSAADAEKTVDEVVVTGTSIRGVAPTGSTLVTVSRETINATSVATTADILRRTPALSGFNAAPAVRADPQYATNLPSIHGLPGAGLVLVLVDGYRAPGAGINTTSFDPSAIPPAALQRVEIVPDGASSVYGSDAVTGVVNLVLRRDLDGVEAGARYGFADHYTRYDASLGAGKAWDSGNILLAYQYAHNSILLGKDRPFINLDHRARQDARGVSGIDFRDARCDPGTVYVGATAYPIPLGAAGAANKCDYSGDNSIVPEDTRNSFVVSGHQELAPNVEFWGQVFGSQHDARTETVQTGYTGLTLNNTNPFFQAPPGVVATTEKLDYSPRNLIGRPLEGILKFKTLAARAGVNWRINDNWDGKFVGNFGQEHDLIRQNTANAANFNAALAGTTPATALNPFPTGGATSAAVIASLRDFIRTDYDTKQKLSEGLVTLDGALFHIAGGDVKVAFGGSVRHETLDGESTSGIASNRTGRVTATNKRTIVAEFAELFVPLFSSANAVPGIRKLGLSASIRHDDYDDVGPTTNPKYGFDWSPVDDLMIRGSYSTSFHAPSLADTASASIDARIVRTCCIGGPPSVGSIALPSELKYGGNSALKPETSKNYSLGFDVTPSWIRGLKFGASYFHVAFINQIGKVPANVLYTEPAVASFYTVNPTHAQVLAFEGSRRIDVGAQYVGDPQLLIDLRRQNLGQVHIGGYDFNGSYSMPAYGGSFTLGIDGTYLTTYETAAVAGAGFVSQLGTGGGAQVRPIKLTWRGTIGWSNDRVNAAVYLNYTGDYLFYANNIYHPTRSFTPIDMHLAVNLPFEGFLAGTQATLDVDNILDQQPPFVDEASQANGYDNQVANPLGRVITFGLRKAF